MTSLWLSVWGKDYHKPTALSPFSGVTALMFQMLREHLKASSWIQMLIIYLIKSWDLLEAEYFQLLGKVVTISQQSMGWQHHKCYTFRRHFASHTALYNFALTLVISISLIDHCIQCTCCDSFKWMFCLGTCPKILMKTEKIMVTVWTLWHAVIVAI